MNSLITQANLFFPNRHRMKPFSENNNPLDKDFIEYEKLRKSELVEQQALRKLKVKTVPPSGSNDYNYLQETLKKNGMTKLKNFLQ